MTLHTAVAPTSLVSKEAILRELAPYVTPNDRTGLILFSVDFLAYVAGLALVLFGPSLSWKILGSVIAGFKMAGLITLGHDAAHRMLVKSKRLNKWLAYACFVPIFHNYRIWIWDHHEVHHPKTNGEHFDSYTPYSKVEFDQLPWHKQMFERIIRSRSVVGFGIHYLFQRMPRRRIVPTKSTPKRHVASAWRHFAVLVAYQAVFLTGLYMAPLIAPVTSSTALLLGFFVPMFLFATLVGGSLYLMHTNRRIPWFKGELDRKGDAAVEYCSTHLTLPAPLSKIVHHVFAHSVHHAHPSVPCYRTPEAQARLDELLGASAVKEPMSFISTLATLKACKLYDFEKHQWLDFKGNPTTEPINLRRTPTHR